jgi:MinD-like ATPase involved in chromosome partitioning or flagellar assembly
MQAANDKQVLAVWGSPGAGKKTIAVKIAKVMEANNQSVALILCDNEIPGIPILLPNGKSQHISLGELLSQTRISEASIMRYFVPFGNSNIMLLGYCAGENEKTHVEYSVETAKKFLVALSRFVDVIIIDCSSHLNNNLLSIAALEAADITLRVVNASLRSATYIRSQKEYLNDSDRFHYDNQRVVLNNLIDGQDEDAYSNVLGKASYVLRHCPSVAEQYESGKLLKSLFGREAKQFEPVIKEIVKDVFLQ